MMYVVGRDYGDDSEKIKASAQLRLRNEVTAVPVTPRSAHATPRTGKNSPQVPAGPPALENVSSNGNNETNEATENVSAKDDETGDNSVPVAPTGKSAKAKVRKLRNLIKPGGSRSPAAFAKSSSPSSDSEVGAAEESANTPTMVNLENLDVSLIIDLSAHHQV